MHGVSKLIVVFETLLFSSAASTGLAVKGFLDVDTSPSKFGLANWVSLSAALVAILLLSLSVSSLACVRGLS